MRTAIICLFLLAGAAVLSGHGSHAVRARTPVSIPDIGEYQTLKCDFHMHTVFSDGKVWPDMRSEEAWREGLDVIAITDHIEYQPHKADLPTNHNRAYEIAAAHGEPLGIIVIRGSEITRQMPPGHLNAIFLEDATPLDTSPDLPRSDRDDWRDAIAAAHAQQAFIFWNHPAWRRQAPDGIAKWYPEHTEIYESGMLHGIEIVNDHEYSPESHQWAIEKNLTLLSNSDVHPPTNMHYTIESGGMRPLTLVFAKERTEAGVREALFDRRTAVLTEDRLIGDARFLGPIFHASVKMPGQPIRLRGRGTAYWQIHNTASIPFELELADPEAAAAAGLDVPDRLTLHAGRTSLMTLRASEPGAGTTGQVRVAYRVTNLLVRPGEALVVELPIAVEFSGR